MLRVRFRVVQVVQPTRVTCTLPAAPVLRHPAPCAGRPGGPRSTRAALALATGLITAARRARSWCLAAETLGRALLRHARGARVRLCRPARPPAAGGRSSCCCRCIWRRASGPARARALLREPRAPRPAFWSGRRAPRRFCLAWSRICALCRHSSVTCMADSGCVQVWQRRPLGLR